MNYAKIMIKKKIVYIAHPINGNSRGNILKVLAICQHVHRGVVMPIAPYLTPLSYLDDTKPKERAKGLIYNREFFKRGLIDELWLYGEKISDGMLGEIKLAKKYQIPIIPKSRQTKKIFKTIK